MFALSMDKDSVEDALSTDFDFTDTWSGDTLIIKPIDLEYEADYTVELSASARDSTDHKMGKSVSFTFNTGPVPPPEITDFEIEELDDDPPTYSFTVDADDPDDNTPLEYHWEIGCGYLYVDDTNEGKDYIGEDDSLEWKFNVPGDCDNADLTLTVTNALDAETVFIKSIFG